MRPHVSISLIDFVGNGLEGGETLHLRTLLHYIVDSVICYQLIQPHSTLEIQRSGTEQLVLLSICDLCG